MLVGGQCATSALWIATGDDVLNVCKKDRVREHRSRSRALIYLVSSMA